MIDYKLEICANSIQSALHAQQGGADRIELCQDLESGGITPSYGLIQVVKQRVSIPVHVLIRPRPGNFIYDDDEFDIMLADIQACQILDVDGIAVGILNGDHQVDMARMRRLVEAAAPMQVTFHRAFDDVFDKPLGLEQVIETGCTRILTAGASSGAAIENKDRLAQLVSQASGRVVIMPASRVAAADIVPLARLVRAHEFHASATRTRSKAQVKYETSFSAVLKQTDAKLVRDMAEEVKKLRSQKQREYSDHGLPPAYSPS